MGPLPIMPVPISPSEMEGSLWTPPPTERTYRLSRDPNIWLLILLALYAGLNGLLVQLGRAGLLPAGDTVRLLMAFVGPPLLLLAVILLQWRRRCFHHPVLMVVFVTLTLLFVINVNLPAAK